MRKNPVLAVLCLVLTIWVFVPYQATAAAPRVVVNGRELQMDVQPVIEGGRTLVPLSVISSALAASIDWDETSRTVTVIKDCDRLTLAVGASTAYKNGSPLRLEVPAHILEGRTMVPLSFIGLALGASVDWDAVTGTVFIYSTNDPPAT